MQLDAMRLEEQDGLARMTRPTGKPTRSAPNSPKTCWVWPSASVVNQKSA